MGLQSKYIEENNVEVEDLFILKYLTNSLILIDIREIDANDYLDYINAGHYLIYEKSNQAF